MNEWHKILTDSDHKKTEKAIINMHAGQMYHSGYCFYVTILSTKDGVTVNEKSVYNEEGDIVQYRNIEEFIEEYSLNKEKNKYSIEYMNDVPLERYWECKNLEMDCQ